MAALEMARKYDMDGASRCLLLNFKGSQVLPNNPVEAFCAAYSRELGEAAEIAARASLKHRLNLDDVGDTLQRINGPAFHKLWRFHRVCSGVAFEVIAANNFSWIPVTVWWRGRVYEQCSGNCDKFKFTVGSGQPLWMNMISWKGYLDRACEALQEHPCSEAVTNEAVLRPSYEAPMCEDCRKRTCGLLEFSRYLGEEVDSCLQSKRGLEKFLEIPTNLLSP
jgi:hypothetical protein